MRRGETGAVKPVTPNDAKARLGDFSANSDGRLWLTCEDSISILLLDFLQVLPESIKIFAEVLDKLFAGRSCLFHDGVFPHAISLP